MAALLVRPRRPASGTGSFVNAMALLGGKMRRNWPDDEAWPGPTGQQVTKPGLCGVGRQKEDFTAGAECVTGLHRARLSYSGTVGKPLRLTVMSTFAVLPTAVNFLASTIERKGQETIRRG